MPHQLVIFATQEVIALRVLLQEQEPIVHQAITAQKVQPLLRHVQQVLIAAGLEGLLFLIATPVLEDTLVQLTL